MPDTDPSTSTSLPPAPGTVDGPPKLAMPPALIAPVSFDSSEANTIVLFPVHLEFLAVRVVFHRTPVAELSVRLTASDGTEVAASLKTDEQGVARLLRRVPAGTYVCEVERQAPFRISTVPTPADAFPVVLPVGRPYFDMHEGAEFERPSSARSRAAENE
jgi:hypothetical protein